LPLVTEGADGGTAEFFTLDERYRALSERGDPLVRLASLINFEVFRAPLAAALRYSDRSRRAVPPYNPVLIFKTLLRQALSSIATRFFRSRRRMA